MKTDLANCNFKTVPGFGNRYCVDLNTGDVYSFKKLKPYKNKFNYLRVKLCDGKNVFQYFVHKIVMSAKLGYWVNGIEIDHQDRNRGNNHPDNLQHISRKDNLAKRDYTTPPPEPF